MHENINIQNLVYTVVHQNFVHTAVHLNLVYTVVHQNLVYTVVHQNLVYTVIHQNLVYTEVHQKMEYINNSLYQKLCLNTVNDNYLYICLETAILMKLLNNEDDI